MRYIEKQPLPDALEKMLSQARSDDLSWKQFSETFAKSTLRDFLAKEQAGLCAYSELSLHEFGFHIEHITHLPEGCSTAFKCPSILGVSVLLKSEIKSVYISNRQLTCFMH